MNESNSKHESHQRRDAAASLPPRPGAPFPFGSHRAESIPLALLPLIPFPLTISLWAFLSILKFDWETPCRKQEKSANS